MWSKSESSKEVEQEPPRSTERSADPATASIRATVAQQVEKKATVGQGVKIVGQVFSEEDLVLDGTLEGTVEALTHKVTIGPNGKVHATVRAREVNVLGTILGNLEAIEKIEIQKDARLVGDIRTARIVIHDGAYFKGSIDIVRPEPIIRKQIARHGSPEAKVADDRAELDIKEGRLVLVDDLDSLRSVLDGESDDEDLPTRERKVSPFSH